MRDELHSEEILKLEFEYARETATQAQNDRTVIVNMYLLLVGGVGSLLVAAQTIAPVERLFVPPQGLSLLLCVLGVLGTLTCFKLIRLRQAWYESARAMNTIKAYYLERIPELHSAFLWKPGTIPAPGKAWTITFILAVMVTLLSSFSYAGALHFLDLRRGDTQLLLDAIVFLLALGLQILFYLFALRAPNETKTDDSP
jgi:hypothetical protein